MTVRAFKHEPTGNLFEDEKLFKKFVAKYDKEQKKLFEEAVKQKEFIDTINAPRMTATSIEDYRKKVLRLYNTHYKDDVQITSLSFECNFKMCVSNSHSHPIGGVSNWCGHQDHEGYPRGYPGWEGRVYGTMNGRTNRSIYELEDLQSKSSWNRTKIPGFNTGSGSGGENFRYELRLYLMDFPLIEREFKTQLSRREALNTEHIASLAADVAFKMDQTQYVSMKPEVMDCQNKIDDYTNQINKLTEARRLITESLGVYKKEYAEQYIKETSYDLNRTADLKQKLNFVEQQIVPV